MYVCNKCTEDQSYGTLHADTGMYLCMGRICIFTENQLNEKGNTCTVLAEQSYTD